MFYSLSRSKWFITLKDWIKNDEVRIYLEIPFFGLFPPEGVNIDFRGKREVESFYINQVAQKGVSHLKIG